MVSSSLAVAIASFQSPHGYLNAASTGLPTRQTVSAIQADLTAWSEARTEPQAYDAVIDSTRASYAGLVGVPSSRVAVGSQVSAQTSLVAAAAPAGSEVLVADGDFTSIIYPFLSRPGITVRSVPLDALADSISSGTWLVVFSLVQSATGEIADVEAILESATRRRTLTFCDLTQAAGVLPVDASLFDATVCHAYKWLCSPRGVSFLTVSDRLLPRVPALQAGWYAGEDIWASCYGPEMQLAADARRLDVSPAWQAWVGAEPAVAMFAGLDMEEVWAHAVGLGNSLCDSLGMARQNQAIVTWPDPDREQLLKLADARIRVASRAGRLRASFHLWNVESDVESVVAALR